MILIEKKVTEVSPDHQVEDMKKNTINLEDIIQNPMIDQDLRDLEKEKEIRRSQEDIIQRAEMKRKDQEVEKVVKI